MENNNIPLIEGICPICGNKTTFEQHSSDSGLCGGMDYWTTEHCETCGINVEDIREITIEKQQQKETKKLRHIQKRQYLKFNE